MVDLGNAFTGAATGAGLGSAFGPVGTAAGALAGGAAGLFGFGKDKDSELKERQRYSPEQQALIDEATELARAGNKEAMEWLTRLYSDDPEVWADFERPFMEQFNEQTVPNILERLNQGQSKGNSSINLALGQAGRKLGGDLATLRAETKLNAGNQIRDFSRMALTEKTQPYIQEGSKGAFSKSGAAAGAGYASLNR